MLNEVREEEDVMSFIFITSLMLDDVHEEDGVPKPLIGVIIWNNSLALGCIVELTKTTLPLVKISFFI